MAFQRIVSLLPTATEILFALGVGEKVVAVSHECDYPPEANSTTRILSTNVDTTKSSREIDEQVASMFAEGQNIYRIDGNLLRSIQPDLVITQTQCRVCAVYYDEVQQTVEEVSSIAEVLPLEANGIDDIFSNIMKVAKLVGAESKADEIIGSIKNRVENIRGTTTNATKVSTCFIEWLDPIYLGGHWVPEMIEIAGGYQPLQQKWKPSIPRKWEQVVEVKPDILVICPCSYKISRTLQEFPLLASKQDWIKIPAVKNSRVFVADESYFSRSGPRFIDGLEILASIIHPEIFGNKFLQGKGILHMSTIAQPNRNSC
ncbi:MAG: cobalamin-binding protein [Thaumarchaeota archaeon]|nr:cobalamin-binding protein [Nitrososphaerota archaeon]